MAVGVDGVLAFAEPPVIGWLERRLLAQRHSEAAADPFPQDASIPCLGRWPGWHSTGPLAGGRPFIDVSPGISTGSYVKIRPRPG